MTKSINDHEGKKYLRRISSPLEDADGHPSILVDVYAVLEAFGVACPARAHCIKKLLCCGNRGKGSELDDLIGAEAALSRAIELQKQRESWDGEPIPSPLKSKERLIEYFRKHKLPSTKAEMSLNAGVYLEELELILNSPEFRYYGEDRWVLKEVENE